MAEHSHYPSFNVMNEQDAWDDHTQAILESRLNNGGKLRFLSVEEASMLETVCSVLTNDNRVQIIEFIISHIDSMLDQSMGESQRKNGLPEARQLVRKGLQAFNESVMHTYGQHFTKLNESVKNEVLKQLSEGSMNPPNVWKGISQKPLFEKLLNWTIEAYCSHPVLWSDIGYAGPAYPRGYMRTQLGQLEPWEAQPEA